MDNELTSTKKRIIKFICNIAILMLLIYLTFRIILKDQNMSELISIIRNAKVQYILCGVLCMIGFFTCDAFNMRRTLVAIGEKCSLVQAIKYVLIGMFFSDITPAASGGQPMQIIYMRKDGIKVSSSTIALILNLLSFQTLTIVMGIVSMIALYGKLGAEIALFLIIGVLLNSISLSLVLIGIYSEKMSEALVRFFIKIMRALKIKNIEEKEASMEQALSAYQESAKYIRSNKKILIKQFEVGIIQQTLFYSVPFFVLLAFGFPQQNIVYMITLQSVVFAMTSGIPLPGAVGVSEGAFINIFMPIFTEEYINGAVILSRGISFYAPFIISAIVVIFATIRTNNNKEKVA